ncbi:MAG: HIT domain-containing protein, partial [Rhodoferax sp.]|nr:HIT domain-containing protein [Rhodoferax sp.]
MVAKPCPFCTLPPERIARRNTSGVLVRDAYPVSQGHSLIIPNRHIGSFFDLSDTERADLLDLLDQARRELDGLHQPDGYHIGINDGPAAGQPVPHLHIHLIPR